MPRGDKTGPMGMGPMTGRAAGFCSGSAVPGYANATRGRGGLGGAMRGLRRGAGRGQFGGARRGGGPRFGGWIPRFSASPTREEQLNIMKEQAEEMTQELGTLKSRIAELESNKNDM